MKNHASSSDITYTCTILTRICLFAGGMLILFVGFGLSEEFVERKTLFGSTLKYKLKSKQVDNIIFDLRIPKDKEYIVKDTIDRDLNKLFYHSNFTFTSTHLGFSPQKSGTTALTWIAQVSLDALRDKNNPDIFLYSFQKGNSVLVDKKKKEGLMFVAERKHEFILSDCGELITKKYENKKNTEETIDYFRYQNLSPLTTEGLNYLKSFIVFKEKVKKEYKCKSKQVILFRDPIEGAFSWLKYNTMPKNITLRNTEFDEYCERLVLHAGIAWQYFKVIFIDRKDINYTFLYYKDLIEDKENFIKKFLNIIEINVTK